MPRSQQRLLRSQPRRQLCLRDGDSGLLPDLHRIEQPAGTGYALDDPRVLSAGQLAREPETHARLRSAPGRLYATVDAESESVILRPFEFQNLAGAAAVPTGAEPARRAVGLESAYGTIPAGGRDRAHRPQLREPHERNADRS